MSGTRPYRSLEELGAQLEERSLLDYMVEETDGNVTLPYKQDSLDEGAYVQTVINIHFDETYGTPYWREIAEELDFDPREEINSLQDLEVLGEADEEALKQRPVEDFMPRLFSDQERGTWDDYSEVSPDAQGYDFSKSSGSTGKKKIMPWREPVSQEMIDWYVYNLDVRDIDAGNWLIAGPPGLYEEHMTGAAKETGGIPFYNGMQTRGLKPQLKNLGEAVAETPGFLKNSLGNPGKIKSAVEGLVRNKYTEQAIQEDLQSENVEVVASAPQVIERIHGMLDSEETFSTPDDIEAVLASGMSVDEDFMSGASSKYPNAEVIPMYATSFTGANFDDPESDTMEYHSLYPFVSFDVVERGDEHLEDRQEADYGERGQVVFNHLSPGFLWPNQAERETAVRVEPSETFETSGDGISSIKPLEG